MPGKTITYLLIIIFFSTQTYSVNFINQNNLPPKLFIERRNKLLSYFSEKSLIIIPSYHYYQTIYDIYNITKITPNLYYLTNLPPQEAILILSKTNKILFLKIYDAEQKLWHGETLDTNSASMFTAIDKILEIEKIDQWLKNNIKKYDTLYIDNIEYNNHNIQTENNEHCEIEIINTIKKYNPGIIIKNKIPYIDEMRKIKDTFEINLISKAVEISCNAHLETIKQIVPNLTEYQIQAIMEYNFKMNGSERPAYNSIVASGPNTCYLHYNKNTDTLHNGDLILLDCGASYKGYTSDITRTVPINGKFTTEQKIIYQIVLEAQDSAIAACKPGELFYNIHLSAKEVIEKRLKELRILTKNEKVSKYFPHGTSHYIGLDVHDVGTRDTLKPGMILTVEPGIYIPSNSSCDSIWWNIGIRIEDDILITKSGPVILSHKLPRSINEIEKIMTK